MSAPIRVLHLIETFGRGGAELLLAGALPELIKAGFDVRLRALAMPDSILPELKAAKLDARVLFGRPAMRTRELPMMVRGVHEELRRRPVDVLHTHLFNSNIAGRLAALSVRPRPAVVTTLHNPDYSHIGPDAWLLEREARRLVDWTTAVAANAAVIGVSEGVIRDYASHMGDRGPWGRMEVIHNAIDTEAHIADAQLVDRRAARLAFGWRPGQLAVLSVGRLVRQKNYFTLIQTVEALRAMGLDARGLVLGDGPLRDSLRERAGDLVHFYGSASRPMVIRALGACDVYLQTSRWEAFGISILEAMASARPVIASTVDGIPELVEDGVTGRLIDSLDARMFAEEVRRLAERPALGEAWGMAGRQRARERFDLPQWVTRTSELYRRVCAGRAP